MIITQSEKLLLSLPEGFIHLHQVEASPLGIISVWYTDEENVEHSGVQLNVDVPLLFRGIRKTSQWQGVFFSKTGEAFLVFDQNKKKPKDVTVPNNQLDIKKK